MSKHTPGPWKVKYEYNVFCEDRCIASCGGYQESSNSEKNHLIKCANARLIAAAPDLLEACKIILDGYDNPESDGYFDWPEAAEKIRAAIAKAEGNEDA